MTGEVCASAAGSLLVVGLSGTELTGPGAGLARLVRPAGVILFQRNITDAEQTRALLDEATGFCAPSQRSLRRRRRRNCRSAARCARSHAICASGRRRPRRAAIRQAGPCSRTWRIDRACVNAPSASIPLWRRCVDLGAARVRRSDGLAVRAARCPAEVVAVCPGVSRWPRGAESRRLRKALSRPRRRMPATRISLRPRSIATWPADYGTKILFPIANCTPTCR